VLVLRGTEVLVLRGTEVLVRGTELVLATDLRATAALVVELVSVAAVPARRDV
jgi:hypothetical protein